MNVFYKVLTPILALILIPIIIFVPIVQLSLNSILGDILVQYVGFDNDFVSVYDTYELVKNPDPQNSQKLELIKSLFGKDFDVSKILDAIPTMNYLYATAVLLAVVVIITLLIIIFSIFTKKKILCTILSFSNMGILFAMTKCFDAFAKPFINGSVGISQILNAVGLDLSSLGSNLSALKNLAQGLNVLSFDAFKISLFYPASMLLFFIIGVFTLSVFMSEKYADKKN